MARSEDKIKEGARSFLEPGEEILAAVVARPRGWTQTGASAGGGAVAGVIGGELGHRKQELVSAVPLSDVDSIEVKRLAVGRTVTVTVRGVPFKLEVGTGANAKGVAQALEQAKATV